MHDPSESSVERATWLLLIHNIPPKPDYLRVKVRRRLDRLGALPIKSSVYVLPLRDETLEDFQWLAREIEADGGDATVCTASFLAGVTDEKLVADFRAARDADYAEVRDEAAGASDATRARLERRLAAVVSVDWFGAAGREPAERALRVPHAAAPGAASPPRSRTWVTRAGVFVDRIASAWLIRRFIDPDARFAFVRGEQHRPAFGELRFDMFGGEYTHEGDRCTFETLLARFALQDPALRALGEIVHDIDLKDDRFAREETAGVAAMLAGLAAATPDDAERLARGALLFDGLYAALGGAAR